MDAEGDERDEASRLTSGLTSVGPADPQILAEAGETLGLRWPSDYVVFMTTRGGGVEFVGESYVDFSSADTLVALNRGYNPDFAPHLVFNGTNRGGSAFAYARHTDPPPIVQVELIGLDGIEPMADSLIGFLRRLARESDAASDD